MTEARYEVFLRFSSEVTGFKALDLVGTGEAREYLATVDDAAGVERVDRLLSVYEGYDASGEDERSQLLRRTIFGDEMIGPIARNIIKLWYVGIWYQLPVQWRETYGAHPNDVTRTVSPNAYTEGLLWPAIGANPAGAKAPGYGSWASPPQIPSV